MLDTLNAFLISSSNLFWTYLIIPLCVTAGIYFTLRLMFIQVRCFPHAMALLMGKYDDEDGSNGISTFQALSTALSSTTGIGNIAGVAVAINLGGPGAIFWMWMMALLGMALKYAEATLGSLYREPVSADGQLGGGPMVYIHKGLGEKWRPMASFYAACTAVACLGAWNMFQSNQAAATLQDQLAVPTWVTGLVLSIFVTLVLVGGIKRIASVASRLVPTMCLIYLATVLVICVMNFEKLPAVFELIVTEAFNFEAAGGGAIGTVILIGIRRAVFSNEAGTGSAAIAHAAAQTRYPVRQGIAASLGPFIDTIVVCAATAFVILLSGFYGTESYQNNSGARISFEGDAEYVNEGWLRSSLGELPLSLQNSVDGDYALSNAAGSATPLTITLNALEANASAAAIRFSVLSDSAAVGIELVDAYGAVLFAADSLKVAEKPDSEWQLDGRWQRGHWGAFILKPPNDAAEFSSLRLRFTPAAGESMAIDRIEFVTAANGIVLSTAAFSHFYGWFGGFFIPIAALLFAYSTILAGYYYGEIACQYLNPALIKPYLWLYIGSVFAGCVMNLSIVINFSDLTLGIMTIPNLIAVGILLPVIEKETREYFAALRSGKIARRR